MTLRDLKAECKEHEALSDGYHAGVDKLSEEGKGGTCGGKSSPFLRWEVVATLVIAGALIAAGIWFLTRPNLSNDVPGGNTPPVIDSSAFVYGPNGVRVWINASDSDDAIVNITVRIFTKAPGNESYLWPPALQKVYWVNETSANVSDVILLGGLLPGDYWITAFATDASGTSSTTVGNVKFTLP